MSWPLGKRGTEHPRSRYSDDQRRAAIELWRNKAAENLSQEQVAQRVGCTRKTLIRWLKDDLPQMRQTAGYRETTAAVKVEMARRKAENAG